MNKPTSKMIELIKTKFMEYNIDVSYNLQTNKYLLTQLCDLNDKTSTECSYDPNKNKVVNLTTYRGAGSCAKQVEETCYDCVGNPSYQSSPLCYKFYDINTGLKTANGPNNLIINSKKYIIDGNKVVYKIDCIPNDFPYCVNNSNKPILEVDFTNWSFNEKLYNTSLVKVIFPLKNPVSSQNLPSEIQNLDFPTMVQNYFGKYPNRAYIYSEQPNVNYTALYAEFPWSGTSSYDTACVMTYGSVMKMMMIYSSFGQVVDIQEYLNYLSSFSNINSNPLYSKLNYNCNCSSDKCVMAMKSFTISSANSILIDEIKFYDYNNSEIILNQSSFILSGTTQSNSDVFGKLFSNNLYSATSDLSSSVLSLPSQSTLTFNIPKFVNKFVMTFPTNISGGMSQFSGNGVQIQIIDIYNNTKTYKIDSSVASSSIQSYSVDAISGLITGVQPPNYVKFYNSQSSKYLDTSSSLVSNVVYPTSYFALGSNSVIYNPLNNKCLTSDSGSSKVYFDDCNKVFTKFRYNSVTSKIINPSNSGCLTVDTSGNLIQDICYNDSNAVRQTWQKI